MSTEKIQVQIRIDEDLIVYVREYCVANERSTGYVVREALKLWIAEQEALAKRGDGPQGKGTDGEAA